jgi:hypothetical protein
MKGKWVHAWLGDRVQGALVYFGKNRRSVRPVLTVGRCALLGASGW